MSDNRKWKEIGEVVDFGVGSDLGQLMSELGLSKEEKFQYVHDMLLLALSQVDMELNKLDALEDVKSVEEMQENLDENMYLKVGERKYELRISDVNQCDISISYEIAGVEQCHPK